MRLDGEDEARGDLVDSTVDDVAATDVLNPPKENTVRIGGGLLPLPAPTFSPVLFGGLVWFVEEVSV